MNTSINGINFIKKEESCVLKSYQDSAGVWTIGWGSTMYRSGKRVGPGETITQQDADDLLRWEVGNKEASVSAFVSNLKLNQNQYDALVSFAYNVGIGALQGSTLLKVIKKNPNDSTMIPINNVTDVSVYNWMEKQNLQEINIIKMYFLVWNKITVNGKKVVSKGLTERRKREADLYFT
jgi:lysozyme